jgi:hypothetical protein
VRNGAAWGIISGPAPQALDLKDEQRLLARVEHLREIVAWADQLQQPLEQAANRQEQTEYAAAVALAHKVLADRQSQAEDKLISLVDQDARTGKHGDYCAGYLLDVSMDADSQLICALDLLSANGDFQGCILSTLPTRRFAPGF